MSAQAWCELIDPDVEIVDPDGWRSPHKKSVYDPIGYAEFTWRFNQSTIKKTRQRK